MPDTNARPIDGQMFHVQIPEERIREFKKLKEWEEASRRTSTVIHESPPSTDAPLCELRDYAFRHGHNDAYLLQRRQLVRILGLD